MNHSLRKAFLLLRTDEALSCLFFPPCNICHSSKIQHFKMNVKYLYPTGIYKLSRARDHISFSQQRIPCS